MFHSSGSEFEVSTVEAGAEFVERALRERPEIAVVQTDHCSSDIEARVAALKGACPDVRIIVLSPASSPEDGAIVELGVFYYLAGLWREKLVQVVEAAARSYRCREGSASEKDRGRRDAERYFPYSDSVAE
jgi:AmiR/NasT family two-component response regulator